MIENGRVKGVRFVKANSSGGEMTPRYIVAHDTAGRLTKFSSVDWFKSPECKTSAHFVVERDGTVTQMVPLNRKAFHAGVSKWKGTSGLNSCSIGIEIVNPGKMDETGKAWFGACCKPDEIKHKSTPEHGDGYWLPYTEAQIAAVKLICTLIVEEYPDCNEILTHWQISPGRKIDTNPLFPLREVRKAVLDPDPVEAEVVEAVVAPPAPPAAPKKIEVAKEVATEGAKSFSVRALFVGFMAWVETQFSFLRGLLPDAQKEVGEVVNPLVSLGGMVKVKLGGVLVVVVAIVILVVIYRHARDKAELKKLKGDAS